MRETTYKPIDCGLHSEYEMLAMHRRHVNLRHSGEEGEQVLKGRVVDVFTHQQAEFLKLQLAGGETVDIRLDRIREIST
ncbi:hypothetical protein [Thiolapillus sp.]